MGATFAEASDVAIRAGREFNEAELAQAQLLLELAAGLICLEVNKNEEWADELDPVPPALRVVSIEVASRVIANPTVATRVDESLGAYRNLAIFKTCGLFLDETEANLVRFAVYGTNSGYSTPDSLADDFGALYPIANRYFPSEADGVADIYNNAVDG